jgi:hypothetical protein
VPIRPAADLWPPLGGSVAYTWDGTLSRLYIDGAKVAENGNAPTPGASTGFAVGMHEDDT